MRGDVGRISAGHRSPPEVATGPETRRLRATCRIPWPGEIRPVSPRNRETERRGEFDRDQLDSSVFRAKRNLPRRGDSERISSRSAWRWLTRGRNPPRRTSLARRPDSFAGCCLASARERSSFDHDRRNGLPPVPKVTKPVLSVLAAGVIRPRAPCPAQRARERSSACRRTAERSSPLRGSRERSPVSRATMLRTAICRRCERSRSAPAGFALT